MPSSWLKVGSALSSRVLNVYDVPARGLANCSALATPAAVSTSMPNAATTVAIINRRKSEFIILLFSFQKVLSIGEDHHKDLGSLLTSLLWAHLRPPAYKRRFSIIVCLVSSSVPGKRKLQ